MDELTLAAVFVGHVILGLAGTLTVYKVMEQNWILGWITSILIAATLTVGEWVVGEAVFVVTVDEMQLLTVAAVIGSLVGILSTIVLTKPDLNRHEPVPSEESQMSQVES